MASAVGIPRRTSRQRDRIVGEARAAMADLLGTDPATVVFGRSMTANTMDLARTLAADWGPGDEVVVTYECTRTDGRRFRNTEVLGFDGDRIRRVEVYFGWDLD